MSRRSTALIKAALSTLHYTGADGLMAPLTQGVGVIFMLHHVTPEKPKEFEPNRILKVTPDFLETAIDQVQAAGFDIVSLDEASFRMAEGQFDRPFACFTFDDGYKDNAKYAFPIFKQRHLPMAIYVPSDFADGFGELWWLLLETVIQKRETLSVKIDGQMRDFDLTSVEGKYAAYHAIYWWLRLLRNETDTRRFVRELCNLSEIDPEALCRELVMTWDEIRILAADPLVTIGSHTRSHYALAKLSAADAHAEMSQSIARIEMELGRPCRHFSYPYGCYKSAGSREFAYAKELGMKTAVTTSKGPIFAEYEKSMTALPRVSLNGDYQNSRYVKVLLSGAPFVFWRMLRRFTPRLAA